MSLFGTLGKKDRRKASVSNQGLTGGHALKVQSASSNGVFKSTPNLYSIEGTKSKEVDSQFDTTSGLVYYDYETSPRRAFPIFPSADTVNDHGGTGGKSPDRVSTSSLSSATHSIGSEDVPTTTPSTKTPFSFLGFVNMVSTASGVKKTKSIRRKAFVSATHLKTTDHTMRDVEGTIHEDTSMNYSGITTPRRSFSSTKRSLSIKSSQSVPNMDDHPQNRHLRSSSSDDVGRLGRNFNGEPGVESSSTSLSSAGTNPSVSENDSYASSRSRCPSVSTRSDIDPDPEMERRKLMLQGAKKFNMDPKKGIDFLVLSGLLERTSESIAQFLKHGEQLSKSAIGNYLGEHHEFNLEVLNCFVELHDFTNVLLVEALRQFLWSFRLPGEAQKIDRMMECFAKRYTQLNPTLFVNSDTCYLLSFAIIMLNTSLHNPNVKEKPSLEQFIQMNRDIDAGQPLDRKFVTSLYNSILTEPFQIPPEDGNDLMLTFFNPAIEGWLWKQGGRYKSWNRRWFVLSNNCLYYFLFTTDKDPRGIIPLENICVKEALDLGKEFCFTLYKKSRDDYIKSCKASDGKLTAGKHLRYHLATKTKEDRDRWITAIGQNNSDHNFYTVLAQKKNRLEAQKRGGTVKRNRNVLVQTPSAGKSPGAMRKSQIGLPLTRLDLSQSFDQLSKIGVLSSTDRGRNPHDYFASTTSSNSNLTFDEDGEYYDSQRSSPVPPPPPQHDMEQSSHKVHYCTQSLPRTKSKKKLHNRHFHAPPIRKFSLPPDTLPSRLTSKVDYLTSPGIRISIEDTEKKDKGQLSVGKDDQVFFPEGTGDSCVPESEVIEKEEVLIESESPPPLPVKPRRKSTSVKSTSSLILALKDFANAMESLDLEGEDEPTNDDDWAEMDSLSVSELTSSGLTKQCLRSSFKSKRSRYRNKHRLYPSIEGKRKSTVINVGDIEELKEGPLSPGPLTTPEIVPFEITIVEDRTSIEQSAGESSDKELQSEV